MIVWISVVTAEPGIDMTELSQSSALSAIYKGYFQLSSCPQKAQSKQRTLKRSSSRSLVRNHSKSLPITSLVFAE